jgi:hypothetical protein
VLFGDFEFQGRLPFSWPANTTNGLIENNAGNPLFSCGYGLTYSQPPLVHTLKSLSI